jgi:hypothetical protein
MREIAILSGVTALGVAAGWVLSRLRKTPEELECRRRALVQVSGRLIDGVCTDVQGPVVHYQYIWRGVEYSSTQDLSTFVAGLPNPMEQLVGPITVKFLPKEPTNSIVFGENWNGFRR